MLAYANYIVQAILFIGANYYSLRYFSFIVFYCEFASYCNFLIQKYIIINNLFELLMNRQSSLLQQFFAGTEILHANLKNVLLVLGSTSKNRVETDNSLLKKNQDGSLFFVFS
ncbi:hypothetical protein ACJX0J_037874, partial [Zea mays]